MIGAVLWPEQSSFVRAEFAVRCRRGSSKSSARAAADIVALNSTSSRLLLYFMQLGAGHLLVLRTNSCHDHLLF